MNVSARKREQILQAAAEEFQEQGFQATSVDRIAQRANVSKRTVYNHFASKEILFLAIITHIHQQTFDPITQLYSPDKSLEKQLLAIAQHEIALLQSPSTQRFTRILLGELIYNPEMAQVFAQQTPSCQQQFRLWLQAACEDGKLVINDIPLATEQFFGLLKASAFWPALICRQQLTVKERAQLAKSTVTMFLRTYKNAGD